MVLRVGNSHPPMAQLKWPFPKFSQHTSRPFMAHPCAIAQWLKMASLAAIKMQRTFFKMIFYTQIRAWSITFQYGAILQGAASTSASISMINDAPTNPSHGERGNRLCCLWPEFAGQIQTPGPKSGIIKVSKKISPGRPHLKTWKTSSLDNTKLDETIAWSGTRLLQKKCR